MADRDIPEEGRRYTLEELTLSPAERERVEVRGLLMAAINDGLDGAITGQVSDRGVERCADHILREWVPRLLAGRSAPSVRDIPEEMVEKAARELREQYDSEHDAAHLSWQDFVGEARKVLSAALAGRQVVDLPEPDARRNQLDGAVDVWNIGGWSVTANADRVAIVTGRDGIGDGLAFYADRARKVAAALLAGADRLDLAAGSGSGEGAQRPNTSDDDLFTDLDAW